MPQLLIFCWKDDIDFTHFFEDRTNVNKPSEIKQPLIKHWFYDINIFLQKQQSKNDL